MSAGSLPVSLIDDFLRGYQPANLGRVMSAAERALAEEVLFDFIVTWLTVERSAEYSVALNRIRQLVGTVAPAFRHEIEHNLDSIERASRPASVQLARREKSFEIMREHLVMLSHGYCSDTPTRSPGWKG